MSKEKEEWRPIKGFEGLYEVSDWGRVKSLTKNIDVGYGIRHQNEKILKQDKHKGYLRCTLHKNGEKKHFLIHRLVANAFLNNTDNLPQVNHKDENKTNNNVENIEYCTAKYNSNYGSHAQKISTALKGKPKSLEQITKMSKIVYQYTLNGELVNIFDSTNGAARKLGYTQSEICRCCKGKIKQYKSYKWSYSPL